MLLTRKKEWKTLEMLYQSDRFKFLILYSRRRVGKTRLLRDLSFTHKSISFSPQKKNKALNLKDFTAAVCAGMGYEAELLFDRWDTAFTFISDCLRKERLLAIIDEFPYIAEDDPSVKSVLQHIIDPQWSHKKHLPGSLRLMGFIYEKRSDWSKQPPVWVVYRSV